MTENRSRAAQPVDVDTETLRKAIKDEYKEVPRTRQGIPLPHWPSPDKIVGYKDEWLKGVPELAIESFAGTGNPLPWEKLAAGERVVDVAQAGASIRSSLHAWSPTGRSRRYRHDPGDA